MENNDNIDNIKRAEAANTAKLAENSQDSGINKIEKRAEATETAETAENSQDSGINKIEKLAETTETTEVVKIKRKISTPTIITIVVVCVLVVAFAIFLPIFLSGNKDNRTLYENGQIQFSVEGEEGVKTHTFGELLALVPAVDFTAIYDTSQSEPVSKTYTGIELKKVFAALNISLDGKSSVSFTASDGYGGVYTIADVLKDNNVYIAFKVFGTPFNVGIKNDGYKLPAEDGGTFVVIKVSDQFSQSRVKMLTKIEVKA